MTDSLAFSVPANRQLPPGVAARDVQISRDGNVGWLVKVNGTVIGTITRTPAETPKKFVYEGVLTAIPLKKAGSTRSGVVLDLIWAEGLRFGGGFDD